MCVVNIHSCGFDLLARNFPLIDQFIPYIQWFLSLQKGHAIFKKLCLMFFNPRYLVAKRRCGVVLFDAHCKQSNFLTFAIVTLFLFFAERT